MISAPCVCLVVFVRVQDFARACVHACVCLQRVTEGQGGLDGGREEGSVRGLKGVERLALALARASQTRLHDTSKASGAATPNLSFHFLPYVDRSQHGPPLLQGLASSLHGGPGRFALSHPRCCLSGPFLTFFGSLSICFSISSILLKALSHARCCLSLSGPLPPLPGPLPSVATRSAASAIAMRTHSFQGGCCESQVVHAYSSMSRYAKAQEDCRARSLKGGGPGTKTREKVRGEERRGRVENDEMG